ncbi:MAG: hypothetical protein RR555_00750 [Bacteroidales bacterium]
MKLVPSSDTIAPLILLTALILFMLLSPQAKSGQQSAGDFTALLIITDFGTDVDDAQAFAYLAKNKAQHKGKNLTIAGIISTGYIPEIRAKSIELFLNLYGITAPIAIGKPEKTEQEIAAYSILHSLNGTPYETTLLEKLGSYPPNAQMWKNMQHSTYCNKYTSPGRLIDSLLRLYPNNLRVVILAQATQFSNYLADIEKRGRPTPQFHSIYIQGQCDTSTLRTTGRIQPNFAAFNLREDSSATYKLFELQTTTPFIFLSKHATYPLAFTKEETNLIGRAGYPGDYLKTAAYTGLQSFLKRDPGTFYKIFKATSLDSLKTINNPYDLLTVIAINSPRLFAADTVYVGKIPHILIDRHVPTVPKEKFWE